MDDGLSLALSLLPIREIARRAAVMVKVQRLTMRANDRSTNDALARIGGAFVQELVCQCAGVFSSPDALVEGHKLRCQVRRVEIQYEVGAVSH